MFWASSQVFGWHLWSLLLTHGPVEHHPQSAPWISPPATPDSRRDSVDVRHAWRSLLSGHTVDLVRAAQFWATTKNKRNYSILFFTVFIAILFRLSMIFISIENIPLSVSSIFAIPLATSTSTIPGTSSER